MISYGDCAAMAVFLRPTVSAAESHQWGADDQVTDVRLFMRNTVGFDSSCQYLNEVDILRMITLQGDVLSLSTP